MGRRRAFQTACDTTDASLNAAIRDIEDFGLHVEQTKSAPAGRGRGRSGGGGVNQTFHAPVTMNQAIATDGATQKIGHMGDATGASLSEIANLLQQSDDLTPRQVDDLTPRQVREGLERIGALDVEVQKPDRDRNWKSVLDCGQAVLAIAEKATDLAQKLAPHTAVINALVQKAGHFLK